MQKWYAGETISLGIGQGYNNFTALQLANATATLVSGGQRFKPRLVREIEDVVTRERKRVAIDALEPLPFKPEHVELVTACDARRHPGRHFGALVHRCAVQERRQDRHRAGGGRSRPTRSTTPRSWRSTSATTRCTSHSRRWRRRASRWRVIVENAGFGSDAAAPIARRVFDYLLLGEVPSDRGHGVDQARQGHRAGGHAAPGRGLPLPGLTVAGPAPLDAQLAKARDERRAAAPKALAPARREGPQGQGGRDERRLRPARRCGSGCGRCSAASMPCSVRAPRCWPRPAWSRCTRPASTTARASSTTAATCCSPSGSVHRGADAAAEADGPGGAAVRAGRGAADRHGACSASPRRARRAGSTSAS